MNPANEVKDIMWNFLKDGQQKADLDEMEQLTHLLIQTLIQKTAGQRANKPNDINIDRLDVITWQLAMSAMCFVLDERFPKIKGQLYEIGKNCNCN